MKRFAFSSSSAKVIGVLFPFLLGALAHPYEHFFKCFPTHISNSTSAPIIYTLNNPSYFLQLNSSAQNNLFLSPSIPKPFAIVMPFHASHVQAIVHCSKKHGIQIRTRSGGHDYEGLSYLTYNYKVPFLVIDMRNLTSISIDIKKKVAWVQAGATLGELYYRIGERSQSLGFPAGLCPTVGVGGHFGGGGYGFTARKYGLSADNIIDAQLVDAEGRILDRKSMGEDLFWAIRGGGAASFGIVLAWKIQLVPVPSIVTAFIVKRDVEHNTTKKLINRWQRHAHKVSDDLTTFMRFQTMSSLDDGRNKKVVLGAIIRGFFLGSMDKLLQLMEKEFPELDLLKEECIETSWVESFLILYSGRRLRNGESLDILLDRRSTLNMISSKIKSDYVKDPIPDDVLESVLVKLYEEEVGTAAIELFPSGGRLSEISESTIPFPHRAGNLYSIQYSVEWDGANNTMSNKHISWIRGLYNYMTPYVSKNPRETYFNFRDLDIGINNNDGDTNTAYKNIAQARSWGFMYFKNNFNRLIHVKSVVDPTNFFRDEQSIPSLTTH